MPGKLLTAILWLVSTVGPLRAQAVAGALEGRVVAGSAVWIEGAEITVEGAVLQGTRTATSDFRGRFTLPSLPPGSYSVGIRRIGFRPLRLLNVPVRLGSTTTLGDVRLEPQAVELTDLVVSGARPVMDPVSAATRTTLDFSRFLFLPADRDFRGLLPFVPQANSSPYPDDGVNIGGSTGLENAFYIDGMNVTTGLGGSRDLPFNFVREIQVATGGYEAEYGRALSGVINVATPSGGNDFHGQVLGFFSGSALRTPPRVGVTEATPVRFSQYDLGLSLSGPILHNRLWYFGAYDPQFANQDASLAQLPHQRNTEAHHLVAGKLTWRAGARTDITATLLGDPSGRDALAGVLPATTSPATALVRATGGGTTVAIQTRHEFTPRTQLTVAVSRLDRRGAFGPRSGSTSLEALTHIDDYTTSISSGGTGYLERSREARTAVRLALSLLGGAHAVKIGAEYEDNAFSDSLTYSWITRLPDGVYNWFELSDFAHVHNRVPTLYVEDAWEVSRRLRLSLGVRWDAEYLSGAVGPSRTIGMELAPRLGVVYQLGAFGSQRLVATVGRFFEQVPPFALIWWNGSGGYLNRDFPQNPLNDSSNGVLQAHASAGSPATPDLRGQYYDQITIGYDRQVERAVRIGLHASYRALGWALEDGFLTPQDSVFRMGNPGRGPLAAMPRARERYTALELSLERSTPGPLYLLASYVLSRNVGNYTGLYATDAQYGSPNTGPQYDDPESLANAYGLLPNDRTHVAKVAVSYRFGFGARLGGFLTVASGTPRSEYGTSTGGGWTFVRPRGSAGRTPTTWSIDLHGAYDLPVGRAGRVRPRLLLDVFNLGSPRRALLYDQTHYLDYARTQVNPNYGAVTHHQPPMSARVGMVVDF
jgi:hypothetical protein